MAEPVRSAVVAVLPSVYQEFQTNAVITYLSMALWQTVKVAETA